MNDFSINTLSYLIFHLHTVCAQRHLTLWIYFTTMKKVHFLPIYTRRYIFFIMINEYNVKCPCLHSKTISFRFHPKNIRQLVNEKKMYAESKRDPLQKIRKEKKRKGMHALWWRESIFLKYLSKSYFFKSRNILISSLIIM